MNAVVRQAVFLVFLIAITQAASYPKSDVINICDDIQEPLSLNPYQIFSEKAHILIQQIMEGLIRFDSEGALEPAISTHWERTSPLAMRFHLRSGVVFHNGEPLTADTVKFSVERYIDPATKSPAAGFLDSIARVDVIDESTVDIVTKYPDGLLLKRLAAWVHICPKQAFTRMGDKEFGNSPIGTGPFQFKEWRKNREIELEAFPDYWNAEFPKAKGLIFKFIPMDRQVKALLNGEIDILTSLPGTQTLDVQMNPQTYVIKKPSLYTVAGSFNISNEPLSNKRIREALNMAINKEDLIRYDILGNGRIIAAMSMPGEVGHNKSLKPYPYDPEKAKTILKEEGFPNGFSLKVFLKANAQRTGKIVTEHLKRIGVQLNSTLVHDAEIFTYLQDRSQWDLLLADCPDPMYHNYFISAAFLYSKSPFSLSKNEEYDRRLETMIQALDIKEQEKLSEELDKFIHEEALGLFTYQRIRTYGLRRGVEFVPYTSGMHYFQACRRNLSKK